MAQLTVVSAPESAMVALSGLARGKPSDGPFYVLPGNVEVSIATASQRFQSVERGLQAKESRTIVFVNQTKLASKAVAPAPELNGPVEMPLQLVAMPPAEPEQKPYGALKWTALGVGAASLAVGAYALIARNSAAASFNNEQLAGQDACFRSSGRVTGPDGGPASARCSDLNSSVNSMTTLAAIGLVGGASLVALGAVFWHLDTSAQEQRQALSCAPNLANFGLACAGSF